VVGDERRQFERARLPLEMRWEGLSGRHTARIYDLSLSGCYVETLGQVTPGEHISFEIELPTGRWLRLEGEVVHAQPNMGFGLLLNNLPETDRNMLAHLLEYAGDQ
jgi:hypothetical protein